MSASDPTVLNLMGIIETLPQKMTSAAVLAALIRAERAGYQRRKSEEELPAALAHIRLSSSCAS